MFNHIGKKLCYIIWSQVTKSQSYWDFSKIGQWTARKTKMQEITRSYSMKSCMERKLTKHTMLTCFRCSSENRFVFKSQRCTSKRRNNLNKLVDIVTRWASYKTASYTYIKNVQLREVRRKALVLVIIYLAKSVRCQQNSRKISHKNANLWSKI